MLSQADNDLLCRVGPGTLMGNLFREYWLPALQSGELPDPDCPPVRIKLLGEELIAFRDTTAPSASSTITARTGAPASSSAATRSPASAASTTAGSST